MKFILYSLFVFVFISQTKANETSLTNTNTAESVMQYAEQMQTPDQDMLKNKINELSGKERMRLLNICYKEVQASYEAGEDVPMVVIYVLAIILPPLAVGLYTDWGTPTLWNLLFTLIGWIPGVVHAFIVITR